MSDLTPTPELIATARRAAGRDWTVDHRGPIEMETNPHLAQLVDAGYIRFVFVPARTQVEGREDYWSLTDAGRAWLARHDTQGGAS